jgi:DNA-binding NtrC family response regulator
VKLNIMIVDKSPSVLVGFKRAFKEDPYHLYWFQNPHEALEKIRDREFAVAVVAEQTLPETRGIEFFKEVRKRSPDTVRILVDGHLGIKEEIEAKNLGYVYRFVNKPLEGQEFKEIISFAVAQHKTNNGTREVCLQYNGREVNEATG